MELQCVSTRHADRVALTLTGTLDESMSLELPNGDGVLSFDLAGVRRINSVGIHRWVQLLAAACARHREVVLHRLSPAFACQAFMIGAMVERARVASALVPYSCPACPWAAEVELVAGQAVPSHHPCPACGHVAELDGLDACYTTLLAP